MNDMHHLAMGEILGGHYEIVQVLGEDEFEILYLVKDLHMAEQKFVLKELFLAAYTSRNNNGVEIMAKSKQVFEQTKQDVIAEIKMSQATGANTSPKRYGFFEENGTVYTIMEFINSSNLSIYLEANPQVETTSLSLKEEVPNTTSVESTLDEEEKPRLSIFLKILIISILIFMGLAYYSYNMIQKDQKEAKKKSVAVIVNEPIEHPPLEDKTVVKKEENLSTLIEVEKNTKKEKPDGASYIEEGEISTVVAEEQVEPPKAEVYVDYEPKREAPIVIQEDVEYEPNIIELPLPNSGSVNNALGRRIN